MCWAEKRKRRELGCHSLGGSPDQSRAWRSLRCRSLSSILPGPLWGAPPRALTVHTWRRSQRGFWGGTEA